MDRRAQQNHIRAARDWLGRAEDSLSRENDVQGDLKLMLAKAELAHVGHCPRSRTLLLWGRRIAALLVAAGLVAFFWQPAAKSPVPAEPVAMDNSMATTSTEQPLGIDNPPAEKQPEEKEISSGGEIRESYSYQLSAGAKPPAEKEAEIAASPVHPPVPQPQLPDAAKQQLMQSAGKILRQ